MKIVRCRFSARFNSDASIINKIQIDYIGDVTLGDDGLKLFDDKIIIHLLIMLVLLPLLHGRCAIRK